MMKENRFVFADLSTYDVKTAKDFYTRVFNWNYYGSQDYLTAHFENKEVSGLYETPKKFKDMGMPSFWMSYIQVDNVEETVSKAKDLGGILELVDLKSAIGKIALIRDPLGAGFTVYEGNQLNSRFENAKNSLVWNELFVSDVSKVKPFYEGLFSWSIKQTSNDRYDIISKGNAIAAIQEISNDIKGKYEYWGVFFAVEDINATKEIVKAQGGNIIYEDAAFTLCTDPFDAMFHIVPINEASGANNKKIDKSHTKWKAITGLVLIVINLLTNWYWIWAVFFAAWVISDIKSGHTHMLEPVSKKETPMLYWIVILVWAFISIYSVSYYLKPEWFAY